MLTSQPIFNGFPLAARALSLCLFVFSGVCPPGVSHAQPEYQDPWLGSWVSGAARLDMAAWEDGIKIVETRDGEKITAFARMDGKVYPQTGSKLIDGITLKPISERSYEYIGTKAGKIVVRSVVAFPGDGQTRISRLTHLNGQSLNGERSSSESIWKRQISQGDESWYGTWHDGKRTFVMEPWEDGFLMQFSWPTADGKDYDRGSAFGRFDGRDYPESENPNVDTMSFERIDDHTMTMVHKKDGKQTVTATVSISRDGNTRTSSTKGISPTGEAVDSVVTWRRVGK